MNNSEKMTYDEFRAIFESLSLIARDVVNITGKNRNTLEKWAQENVVKDPAAAALFQMAVILQKAPHFYTKKDVVSLMFQSSGAVNPYNTELDADELKAQAVGRLKSIMSQLES